MSGVPKALLMGEGDEGSTVEWGTPEHIFDKWDAIYRFTLDPASGLGYHTSDVILARPGGNIITLDAHYCHTDRGDVERYGRVGSFAAICPFDEDGDDCRGDGLDHAWTGRVWLNHPYGRADWRWVKKAHDSVRFGDADVVVALLPSKTQMRWWHKYVRSRTELVRGASKPYFSDPHDHSAGVLAVQTTELAKDLRGEYGADIVEDIRGRLRFVGAPSSAPFASTIAVWHK